MRPPHRLFVNTYIACFVLEFVGCLLKRISNAQMFRAFLATRQVSDCECSCSTVVVFVEGHNVLAYP